MRLLIGIAMLMSGAPLLIVLLVYIVLSALKDRSNEQ
jgi:hypothetical protein